MDGHAGPPEAADEIVLSPEDKAKLLACKRDFVEFARRCLKIRTKSGKILPFKLNRVQLHLHELLELQRARTGKIRALILKGRQEGCSTYVEGRYYWRVTLARGQRAFILTHQSEATKTLYGMATRFLDHSPEILKPSTDTANARELRFDALDSGYRVATAGDEGAGRSQTNQLLHGSEVAFWQHAADHAAGALQTVPDIEGTEIILESTANGMGNYFHQMWQDAEAELSDYIAVFIPWFWAEEYRKPVPDGFKLSAEDEEYRQAYGLDLEQMAWRRSKIVDLRDEWRFKQEYPANPQEAFQTSGIDSFISPPLVIAARKAKGIEALGALVVGVDPARFGKDRTSIIRRQGRVASKLESHPKLDNMQVAGLVAKIIREEKPSRVFIDAGGGAGIIDRLKEQGYGDKVVEVNFGGAPISPPRPDGGGFLNRRAEMWDAVKEWLKTQVQIPDSNSLHADLCAPTYSYDSDSRLKIERKEDMQKRGLRSPDEGDALALTFAELQTIVQASRWGAKLDYSRQSMMFADTAEAIARKGSSAALWKASGVSVRD